MTKYFVIHVHRNIFRVSMEFKSGPFDKNKEISNILRSETISGRDLISGSIRFFLVKSVSSMYEMTLTTDILDTIRRIRIYIDELKYSHNSKGVEGISRSIENDISAALYRIDELSHVLDTYTPIVLHKSTHNSDLFRSEIKDNLEDSRIGCLLFKNDSANHIESGSFTDNYDTIGDMIYYIRNINKHPEELECINRFINTSLIIPFYNTENTFINFKVDRVKLKDDIDSKSFNTIILYFIKNGKFYPFISYNMSSLEVLSYDSPATIEYKMEIL